MENQNDKRNSDPLHGLHSVGDIIKEMRKEWNKRK